MGGRFRESWPFDINVKAEWNIKNFIKAAQTVLLVKKDYKQIEDVINSLVKESKYYK